MFVPYRSLWAEKRIWILCCVFEPSLGRLENFRFVSVRDLMGLEGTAFFPRAVCNESKSATRDIVCSHQSPTFLTTYWYISRNKYIHANLQLITTYWYISTCLFPSISKTHNMHRHPPLRSTQKQIPQCSRTKNNDISIWSAANGMHWTLRRSSPTKVDITQRWPPVPWERTLVNLNKKQKHSTPVKQKPKTIRGQS